MNGARYAVRTVHLTKRKKAIMFKRKVNVYAMNNEQLDKTVWACKATILEAQELLANALHAQEQIEFNIKFNRQNTEKEFGVKPAVPSGW